MVKDLNAHYIAALDIMVSEAVDERYNLSMILKGLMRSCNMGIAKRVWFDKYPGKVHIHVTCDPFPLKEAMYEWFLLETKRIMFAEGGLFSIFHADENGEKGECLVRYQLSAADKPSKWHVIEGKCSVTEETNTPKPAPGEQSIRWIPVSSGTLPSSGERVLAFWKDEDLEFYETLTYFHEGDIVKNEYHSFRESPYTRLLEDLFSLAGADVIAESGFYMYRPGMDGLCRWVKHNDCITHWARLSPPV